MVVLPPQIPSVSPNLCISYRTRDLENVAIFFFSVFPVLLRTTYRLPLISVCAELLVLLLHWLLAMEDGQICLETPYIFAVSENFFVVYCKRVLYVAVSLDYKSTKSRISYCYPPFCVSEWSLALRRFSMIDVDYGI